MALHLVWHGACAAPLPTRLIGAEAASAPPSVRSKASRARKALVSPTCRQQQSSTITSLSARASKTPPPSAVSMCSCWRRKVAPTSMARDAPGRHHAEGSGHHPVDAQRARRDELVERAVKLSGVAVVIVDSDIADFPRPCTLSSAIRSANTQGRRIRARWSATSAGLPFDGARGRIPRRDQGVEVRGRLGLDGKWNVEGGNAAAMDMLQAHPGIKMIFAANDYEIVGAAQAAKRSTATISCSSATARHRSRARPAAT